MATVAPHSDGREPADTGNVELLHRGSPRPACRRQMGADDRTPGIGLATPSDAPLVVDRPEANVRAIAERQRKAVACEEIRIVQECLGLEVRAILPSSRTSDRAHVASANGRSCVTTNWV